MDTILEVNNLKIAFRTTGGALKAVRNISLKLERGKTLAIVGESGSGKSVTSRAILGILAGNSMVEGGEIIYDGKDLLKISEEDMCKIRGDKISMIFQDPLSSLNPIVKIGRQITEAMLLKNKGNRTRARKEFNDLLEKLRRCMIDANEQKSEEITGMTKQFNNYYLEALKAESSFNEAFSYADELHENIGDLLFMLEKKQEVSLKSELKTMTGTLKKVKNPYLTGHTEGADAKIDSLCGKLESETANLPGKGTGENVSDVTETLGAVRDFMQELMDTEKPDFLGIGYMKTVHQDSMDELSVPEMNRKSVALMNSEFMDRFTGYAVEGLRHSYNTANTKKQAVLKELEDAVAYFNGTYTKSAATAYAKKLAKQVEESIDPMEIKKDGIAYTFRSSMIHGIEHYFQYVKQNPKEEARYARQTVKRDRLIARGNKVDWKVVPMNTLDLDELKDVPVKTLTALRERYTEKLDNPEGEPEFRRRTAEMMEHFRELASEAVHKVSKSMAKEKAIKLMKEVGIPEPRVRYYQYPFEFSGGMRQRIVIAIALAADPDILICDEPTTALDVTIQAQILELINKLKAERHLSVIFITHDLGVVANMADDIAVMYAGKIVEYGTAEDIFYDPRHPYTWALLSSMPDLDTKDKLDAIPGTPPNMIYPPQGDAFAARNKYAMQIDFEEQPPEFRISDTHWAATWLLHPDAPKVETPKTITDRIERMKRKGEQTNG